MTLQLDVCRYTPTAGGTTDWTFSSAVTGYQSPSAAGVTNSGTYRYRAESSDLTQWEIGTGVYNTGTGVLTRATVLYNSSGTGTASGQSGAGTKISFSGTPQVAIVLLAEDVGSTGQIPGTATNDSANAGNIGEYISANVQSGSQVALTTGTPANITTISLTAGDWDVYGTIFFNPAGTTITASMFASISTTSAALALTPGTGAISFINPINSAAATAYLFTGVARVSIASTTTVYLVAQASFSTSTNAAYGVISARRRR